MIKSFSVKTGARSDFVDITGRVQGVVSEAGADDGVVTVFVPHTTAGITVNENADPDVVVDIIAALEKIVPWQGGYRHCEGNSAAHVKASMMGSSVQLPVSGGRIKLGTWQAVYLCEFDGPRTRQVEVVIDKH